MQSKAIAISMERFLKKLRKSGRTHTNGLLHYTTMPAFKSMIESSQVYFSLLGSSDDKGECAKSEREDRYYYMLCFTYGKEENIGMWSIYGVPWKQSIRLKFPHCDIKDWIESVANKDVQYYGVRNRRNQVLLEDANPKVSICDVAYYDGKDGNIFIHDGKTYRILSDDRAGVKPCTDRRFVPYVKKWAWSFEREVRIVLEFGDEVLDSKGSPFRRIAVDFEGPLDAALEGNGEILLGPWCKRFPENVQKRDFPNAIVKKSDYTEDVNLRTHCKGCKRLMRLKRKTGKCKK